MNRALRSTDKRFPGAFPIAYHVNRYRLNRGLSFVPWHASVLSSRLYTPVFVSPEHNYGYSANVENNGGPL